MKRLIFILLAFWVIALDIQAQSPQFSQFYANQVYLNPAFTGNTEINRLAGNYRNQWAGIPGAFHSYSLAYDHNLAAYNLGLGAIALNDQAGSGGLSYTNFSLLAAYRVQILEEITASGGISFGYSRRALNASKLTFGDQFITGGPTTANVYAANGYGDLGAGWLVYGENFWGGLSAAHLNRPNESLIEGQVSRVPIAWTFHGGYTFVLQESSKGSPEKSIIIASNYKFSRKFDQIDLGFYYQRMKLVMGLWYRGIPLLKRNDDGSPSSDAIIALIGMKMEGFRVGYSYDITASQLSVKESYGSHEISFIYEWPTTVRKKRKRKKNFIVPCPKF